MASAAPFTPEVDGQLALDKAMNDSTALPKKDSEIKDDYRVFLPNFEGPLDLLLHLIRKDQLNIYDIPIAHICKSYLEHLDVMKSIDVNIAGEFMVMAASLTLLKSLVLLPKEEGAGEEDDPRMPLVQQLLEYERFKKAADQIEALPWMGRDIYVRPPSAIESMMPVESLLDAPVDPVDPFQLLVCLKIATNRTTRPALTITTDPVSIRDKVVQVGQFLAKNEVIQFSELIPEKEERKILDVVVAFLAVLELARLKFIEIIQHENFGPIQIRGVKDLNDLNVGMLDSY